MLLSYKTIDFLFDNEMIDIELQSNTGLQNVMIFRMIRNNGVQAIGHQVYTARSEKIMFSQLVAKAATTFRFLPLIRTFHPSLPFMRRHS